MDKISCKNCNKELEENERPCSVCGCLNRMYKVELTETIKILDSWKWKHKRPGLKKPITEEVNRYKISRDPKLVAQKVHEIYVIDRIRKWWHQIVKDATTGKILHKEDKSLIDKNK